LGGKTRLGRQENFFENISCVFRPNTDTMRGIMTAQNNKLSQTNALRRWRGLPAMPLAAILSVLLWCGQSIHAATDPEESLSAWQSQSQTSDALVASRGSQNASAAANPSDGFLSQRGDSGASLGIESKDSRSPASPGPMPQISGAEPGVTALWAISALLLVCWRWAARKASVPHPS
jgi:hypothetical protein